jgi:hypothetical protein
VTAFLDKPSDIDPTKLHIQMPAEEDDPMRYFDDLGKKSGPARQ